MAGYGGAIGLVRPLITLATIAALAAGCGADEDPPEPAAAPPASAVTADVQQTFDDAGCAVIGASDIQPDPPEPTADDRALADRLLLPASEAPAGFTWSSSPWFPYGPGTPCMQGAFAATGFASPSVEVSLLVSVEADPSFAASGLDAARHNTGASPAAVGDEAVLLPPGPGDAWAMLAWRSGRVLALVLAGPAGTSADADVAETARRFAEAQQRQIERVAPR
jgi:hypothetical protein